MDDSKVSGLPKGVRVLEFRRPNAGDVYWDGLSLDKRPPDACIKYQPAFILEVSPDHVMRWDGQQGIYLIEKRWATPARFSVECDTEEAVERLKRICEVVPGITLSPVVGPF